MKSPLFSNSEVNLLHVLRSRSINVKCNFRNKFMNDLKCPLCKTNEDDQLHLLKCPELTRKFKSQEIGDLNCVYEDIFSDHQKQKSVTHLIMELLKIREKMVDKNLNLVSDPSTSVGVLDSSDNVQDSIVHYYPGN